MKKEKKLLLFDLAITGHHSIFIKYVLQYWNSQNRQLVLIVAPDFLIKYPSIVNINTKENIEWQAVSSKEIQWYRSSKRAILKHTWVEWRLLCRYAKKTKADDALIMYIDRFQLPLALRLPIPCNLSGIYFRPKFHYTNLPNYKLKKGDAFRFFREKHLWYSALRHQKLTKLFCLDSLAVDALRSLKGKTSIYALPEPFEMPKINLDITKRINRKTLGIKDKGIVFLIFGALSYRKGIFQVLQALELLSTEKQKKSTLLLVGAVTVTETEKIYAAIERIKTNTEVQIILKDEFIPDTHLPAYFAITDVVLTLYQKHVGSSGILIWAAAFEKPILSSNYGLMGLLALEHQLGLTVDSANPTAIKAEIETLLEEGVTEAFNKKTAMAFAQSNCPQQFTKIITQSKQMDLR